MSPEAEYVATFLVWLSSSLETAVPFTTEFFIFFFK